MTFSTNPNGTGCAIVHRFAAGHGDGTDPRHDAMTLINGVLYGTAFEGGGHHGGLILSIVLDGIDYSILHDFRRWTGVASRSCFVEGNGVPDGMTAKGAAHEHGVMFQISRDGGEFDVDYDVKGTRGSEPHGALALSDNVLYGMTREGGRHNRGVIFSIDPEGGHYEVLHDFKGGKDDGASTDHGFVTDRSGVG